MVLDLLFWWEPGVGIWHDGCLRTGVPGCTYKTGFENFLELKGTSLSSKVEGRVTRETEGDAREGMPLVRELARRRIGTHVDEDNAVNDLLIPELKQ
jgi:hypothetical protein